MKKSKYIILILFLFFVVGCGNNTSSTSNNKPVRSNGGVVNTSKMAHKHCTRSATAGDGVSVDLQYDLYYTGDILNILVSTEKVITASDETLTTYEEAYKKIYKNYEGLKYYDTSVVSGDTTVTSNITINYDKLDINKLLEIEGKDDNIIENGKAKVDKWISLAKKFGTKCEEVDS